jgi:hypothetical protein
LDEACPGEEVINSRACSRSKLRSKSTGQGPLFGCRVSCSSQKQNISSAGQASTTTTKKISISDRPYIFFSRNNPPPEPQNHRTTEPQNHRTTEPRKNIHIHPSIIDYPILFTRTAFSLIAKSLACLSGKGPPGMAA